MTSVVPDLLHFVELFSSDEVRRWSRIVWSVGLSFYVWG